jgi:hypothetical protein
MSFMARRRTRTLYIYPFGAQLFLSLLPRDRFSSSLAETSYLFSVLSVFEKRQKLFPNRIIENDCCLGSTNVDHEMCCLKLFGNAHAIPLGVQTTLEEGEGPNGFFPVDGS